MAAEISLKKLEEKIIEFFGNPTSSEHPFVTWETETQIFTLEYPRQMHGYIHLMNKNPLFRRKWTIEEVAKAYPFWERSVKVCLCEKLRAKLIAKGLPEETSAAMAAQGVNYITGEGWEANLKNASSEVKSVVEKHKSEIIPSVNSFLEKDKSLRGIIVYFLRIKSILVFAAEGASSEKQKNIEMADEELKMLGVTREDLEASNKMFGGHSSKWMENPMKERIEKILSVYGPEFPEEADPIKFDRMVLDFHRSVFPKK